MRSRARIVIFCSSLIVVVYFYLAAVSNLPPAGHYRGPYGDVLNDIAVVERHATDVVSAITYDYRALDTLGEEFILFTAVIGIAMILRRHRDEHDARHGEEEKALATRPVSSESDAVRLLTAGLIGISVTFGLYVVTHGQVSPGGGFQGGTILASVPLLVYLAASPERYFRIAPTAVVERGEAVGALAFLAIAFVGYFAGDGFLTNVFPLGPMMSKVDSGGMIFLLSVATGLEVSGGFIFLLTSFVEKTLRQRLYR